MGERWVRGGWEVGGEVRRKVRGKVRRKVRDVRSFHHGCDQRCS